MARPKKIKELENTTAIPKEANTNGPPIDTSVADTAINSALGRFTQAVIVGLLPDGNIDIATSNPNYAVLQWLLARAQFELLTHEKNNYMAKKG
jgi:hypothetical protein